MPLKDIHYLMALNSVYGLGVKAFYRLMERYGSPRNVFSASYDSLISVKGIGHKLASAIGSIDIEGFVCEEEKLLKRYGVRIITVEDDEYPSMLKDTNDPPYLLYIKGSIDYIDRGIALAVVGSRMPSAYGKAAVLKFIPPLIKAGFIIVSGMARGIDSLAHKSVLSLGGRTIAVLGCGIGVTYPPENKRLKEDITGSGAVISEFSMSARPDKMNFPRRNRIISGLTFGTLVIEASSRSGSLITADYAMESGREVFAVPGDIASRNSKGCHSLIKQGAKLVDDVSDIFYDIPVYLRARIKKPSGSEPNSPLIMSEKERYILSLLSSKELHVDELIIKSKYPPGELLHILTLLEISGYIRQTSGKMFLKVV